MPKDRPSGDETINAPLSPKRDVIDLGDGTDTVIYNGPHTDFVIDHDVENGPKVNVSGDQYGIDTLRNVEFIEFDDGKYDVPAQEWVPEVQTPL
jgi:hypothetical protein